MGCCWTSSRAETKHFDGVVLASGDSDSCSDSTEIPKLKRKGLDASDSLGSRSGKRTPRKSKSVPEGQTPFSESSSECKSKLSSMPGTVNLSDCGVTLGSLCRNANSSKSSSKNRGSRSNGRKGEESREGERLDANTEKETKEEALEAEEGTEPDNATELQGSSDSSSGELEAEGQVFSADDISLEKSEGSGGWVVDLPKTDGLSVAGALLPRFSPPTGWWDEEMEEWDMVLKGNCPSVGEYIRLGTDEDRAEWETMPFSAEHKSKCERGRLIEWLDEVGTVPRPVLVLSKQSKKKGEGDTGTKGMTPTSCESPSKGESQLTSPLVERNARMLVHMQHRLRGQKNSRSVGSILQSSRYRAQVDVGSMSVSIASGDLEEGASHLGHSQSYRSVPGFVEDEGSMRDLVALMDAEERRRYTVESLKLFEAEQTQTATPPRSPARLPPARAPGWG